MSLFIISKRNASGHNSLSYTSIYGIYAIHFDGNFLNKKWDRNEIFNAFIVHHGIHQQLNNFCLHNFIAMEAIDVMSFASKNTSSNLINSNQFWVKLLDDISRKTFVLPSGIYPQTGFIWQQVVTIGNFFSRTKCNANCSSDCIAIFERTNFHVLFLFFDKIQKWNQVVSPKYVVVKEIISLNVKHSFKSKVHLLYSKSNF